MLAEKGKKHKKHIFDTMQTTIEPAWTQHPSHVALFAQKATGQGIVPTKVQGCDERNRHDLGINEMTLTIISMAQRSKHIRRQAIHCYNLAVHEEVLLSREG